MGENTQVNLSFSFSFTFFKERYFVIEPVEKFKVALGAIPVSLL